jgi:hypothetical protein
MKTPREYPFAHILREGLNRSQRRLDFANLLQTIFVALAIIACAIILWL